MNRKENKSIPVQQLGSSVTASGIDTQQTYSFLLVHFDGLRSKKIQDPLGNSVWNIPDRV